ncbi:MAG: hypothetical protein QOG43_74 [Actinomycetota bacterium]|jgi:hypothetical protein|nr:hypothetical protein [Actinomycetota bacterium]
MSRRGIVINTLVALIAILITGGLAAQAVVRGPGSADRSSLVAAGVDGRDAVSPPSPVGTASIPTRSTRPGPPAAITLPRFTPPPTVPVTVPPAPDTTLAPDTTVAPTTTPPPFNPPFPMPPGGLTPPTPPPTTVQTSPSSWRLVDNGVTVIANIEPAAPRVGDTVTLTYTTTGEGDFCCWAFVYVDGAVVAQNQMPQGESCPLAPLKYGSASIVVSEAGPFTIQVQGTRIDPLCFGPPTFHTANLFATFPVLPAA